MPKVSKKSTNNNQQPYPKLGDSKENQPKNLDTNLVKKIAIELDKKVDFNHPILQEFNTVQQIKDFNVAVTKLENYCKQHQAYLRGEVIEDIHWSKMAILVKRMRIIMSKLSPDDRRTKLQNSANLRDYFRDGKSPVVNSTVFEKLSTCVSHTLIPSALVYMASKEQNEFKKVLNEFKVALQQHMDKNISTISETQDNTSLSSSSTMVNIHPQRVVTNGWLEDKRNEWRQQTTTISEEEWQRYENLPSIKNSLI